MTHEPEGSPQFGPVWLIADGTSRARIAAQGGAVRSYAVDGKAVIDAYHPDQVQRGYHGMVLAPWPNRVSDGRWSWNGETHQLPITEPARNAALHGLVNWVPWQLVERSSSSVRLGVDVLPQLGYPFALRVEVTWICVPDGLRSILAMTNTGEMPAPAGISVHPYFTIPGWGVDDLTLQVPAETYIETDENLTPVARVAVAGTDYDFTAARSLDAVQLDTAYTNRSSAGVVLSAPSGEALEVWADKQFGWWQVHTSDYFPADTRYFRGAVAIEPMTCGPNALATGEDLIVLRPGQHWSAEWGVRTLTRAA
ncbi:MAG: aldose 1-epimerase family protein [Jatrophihabitans sp.]